MSFYPQPNKYACGPFALKYALVMLGIFVNENKVAQIAGSTWWSGTDEIGLQKAANKYNCKMKYFRRETSKDAQKVLNHELQKGIPCILSVDNWEHWFTVVNFNKGKYVVIDSALNKVVTIMNPNKLMKRWKYEEEKQEFTSFDGYAIYPKFKVYTKANFTVDKARQIMYKRNSELASKWDTYFNDLVNICRPRTPVSFNVISFNEFLRRFEKLLIKEVADWHGTPNYSELKKILDNMRMVAEVYDLVIYEHDERKALIGLSSILMMFACGKYGMSLIY